MSESQQTLTIQQAIDLAIQHHTAGRLPQAETIYQQILQTDPNQPVALHLLGVIAHQAGKNDTAVDLITKALRLKPDFAEAYYNLGTVLQKLGKLEEAVTSYHKALDLKPDYAEAHSNLGNALKVLGKPDDAIASYRKALALKPHFAEAHSNLGNVLPEVGKPEEAAASCRKALGIKPDFAEAHGNLGAALYKLGRPDEAIASYQKALALKPDFAEAYNNLGTALKELGKPDEAIASYEKALGLKPDYADAHNNLGNVLQDLGKLQEAISNYHRALAIQPDYAEAYNNLGNAFLMLDKMEETVASYQKALGLKPDYAEAHSNLMLVEQYRLGHDAETLYELHCEWDERHGRTFRAAWPQHPNIPEIDRRLRIGFVSPNLGRHPVGYFVVSVLENLQKSEIETIIYSDRRADDLTERIKAATGIWRYVRGTSNEELAKTILDDEIDILIDLAGHSGGNRLLVFARKPAPVQVTWVGYLGTTGLSAIDYLVSDIHLTRVDEEEFHSEKVLRMPDGDYVCYDPPDYAPDVGPLPLKQNGFVTFGSFNNPIKLNAEVVSLWARILDGVARSRLLTKYRGIDSVTNIERLTRLFEAKGIDRSRLDFGGGSSPHAELLACYNDVDIALDPFPFSGGLTTLEALWMGVPVITVPGETFASRLSLCHLSTMGLKELVARDQDNYVELAVSLAKDTNGLVGLRTKLREKMASSPICDGKKFAEGFSTIMRQIWRDWCLSHDSGNRVSS